MITYKENYLNQLYSKLSDMLEDDKHTSRDILDLAIDIISQQKRVIKELKNNSGENYDTN